MDDIITALQGEISAAQLRHSEVKRLDNERIDLKVAELIRLAAYIQGLNTALYLLTREPSVKELQY